MNPARNPRWLMSFADLCLLLLGFFVLLQARQNDAVAAQSIRDAFRAAEHGQVEVHHASALFEPGEAVLRPAQSARLTLSGAQAARSGARIRIESAGVEAATARFDAWELAAARAAAVARAIARGGLPTGRIDIAVAPASAGGGGQVLTLATLPLSGS
jgi:flagellar motor protein MotB